MKKTIAIILVCLALIAAPALGAGDTRYRVIVSTDIGGTDPDDFQSLVHLFLYADVLDIEGLVSSPFGPGRVADIHRVIDLYEADYDRLRRHSDNYPEPDELRRVTRQGAVDVAPYRGYTTATEGSDWIIERARADDERPLYVLVWGGIEDLAQALHDAPDIVENIRVYWIGGPNKKWSPDAYQYIATDHRDLHIIETNAAYRGWFVGGNQEGAWHNQGFVTEHVAGCGALGEFFTTQLGGTIKMGDTPSVAFLLHGGEVHPSQPGWGGRFVRAWERPHKVYERPTDRDDTIEEFGIFELALPLEDDLPADPQAQLVVENQALQGHFDDGRVRFRFSPKGPRVFSYEIRSNVASLNGLQGELTAVPTSPDRALEPDSRWPHWWTDDPSPEFAEPPHIGARTVNRWRVEFLTDFAARLARLEPGVSSAELPPWGPDLLDQDPQWYVSPAALAIADSLLAWQSSVGAWPKNTDFAAPATAEEVSATNSGGRGNTIDNDATTLPMRYLARVAQATGDERYEAAFLRGLDYLFAAQYENGGWPQFFPLRDGYYSRVTFNDNAMMNVMFLLSEIAARRPPLDFVDSGSAAKADLAVARGLDLILRTQLRQDGELIGWAAQYDEVTLEPAWARAYEPPSVSGNESVAIVRFLMQIDDPSPAVVAAIEGAVQWFERAALHGIRYERGPGADGNDDAWTVPDDNAGPLWARFYELDSGRPIFLGRDSVTRYSLAEIEQERRGGYAYYGTWPGPLLDRDYPDWRRRQRADR